METKANNTESDKEKRRICLNNAVELLYIFGFWPSDRDEPRKYVRIIRRWFPTFHRVHFIYILATMGMGVIVNLSDGDYTKAGFGLTYCLFFISVFVHSVTLSRNSNGIRDMIDTFDKMCSEAYASEYNMEVLRRTNRITNFLTKEYPQALGICVVIFSIPLYIQCVITRDMMVSWYPIDYASSPKLEIIMLIHLTITISDIMVMLTCDMLFVVLILQLVAHFQVLRYNLENVQTIAKKMIKSTSTASTYTVKENIQEPTPHVPDQKKDKPDIELYPSLNVPNYETKPEQLKICSNHDVENTSAVSEIKLAKKCLHTPSMTDRLNIEMYRIISECVSLHVTVLELANDITKIFEHMLAFQIFIIVVILPLGVLIVSNNDLSPVLIAAYASGLCGLYLQNAIFCQAGNALTTESLLVRDAAFACDWLNAPERITRALRIIMSRSQQPTHVYAGVYLSQWAIPMTMETFEKVCKESYRFLTVLIKVIPDHK